MRPTRLLVLLAFFIALPVFLTCLSLFSGSSTPTQPLGAGIPTRPNNLRALFSFSTPSSLFPPSAVISLTNDNSTFFLARPAAFGPGLPSHGLSGQLWVGKGFGDEALLSEEELRVSGYELGCSDVPGWDDDHKKKSENGALEANPPRMMNAERAGESETRPKSILPRRIERQEDPSLESSSSDDGTDDHLHRPLADSNPASPVKHGEPAEVQAIDKSRTPTHADIESLQESAVIAGKIVMLSRGGCGFLEKVKWAQRRGGIALIVGDNERGGQLTIMYAKGDTSNVTIPALFTSYNAAHLLSSLVPADGESDKHGDSTKKGSGSPRVGKHSGTTSIGRGQGPVFTSTESDKAQQTMAIDRAEGGQGFVQNVLLAVGLADSTNSQVDDSRRPPSSGNIDWILLEDWDEDKPASTSTSTIAQTQNILKAKPTTRKDRSQNTNLRKAGDDDFVIGVQDWRDVELVAPKQVVGADSDKENRKIEDTEARGTSQSSSGRNPVETSFRGGSITPGSGEYNSEEQDKQSSSKHGKQDRYRAATDASVDDKPRKSLREKFCSLFHRNHGPPIHQQPAKQDRVSQSQQEQTTKDKPHHKPVEHEGLWVTLTPTSVSSSPFFDTLLVLVVSPLVTLTFVYGLLLLRSRIRRRRWRAPKSIVERLPIRTYHTMTATSSTTSSQLGSPAVSSHTSPQLRPASARPRPRSQTTTGIVSPLPVEKNGPKVSPKRKPYTGRQVECVVCLEEYVDGESRVMSLPCGHEFHAECITPWLVTRRRTCPICKGDVVRSLARSTASSSNESAFETDLRYEDEQTSDDVQDRAAETVNDEGSAAIPIPSRESDFSDEDVERGDTADAPLLSETRSNQQGSGWRGMLSGSISRLSGETVWRSSTPNDRTR